MAVAVLFSLFFLLSVVLAVCLPACNGGGDKRLKESKAGKRKSRLTTTTGKSKEKTTGEGEEIIKSSPSTTAPKSCLSTTAPKSSPTPAAPPPKPAKQVEQERKIAEAIKKGDLLPQNDYETINDVQSNWGSKQVATAEKTVD